MLCYPMCFLLFLFMSAPRPARAARRWYVGVGWRAVDERDVLQQPRQGQGQGVNLPIDRHGSLLIAQKFHIAQERVEKSVLYTLRQYRPHYLHFIHGMHQITYLSIIQ